MNRRALLKAMAMTAGGLLLPTPLLWAGDSLSRITDVRMWSAPDHTRIVFQMERASKHNLFLLKQPDRLVLDVEESQLTTALASSFSDEVVRTLRTGALKPGMVRVVIELAKEVRPRSFVLKDGPQKGARLVVDLYRKDVPEESDGDSPTAPSKPQPTITPRRSKETLVIALDPGHGGEDPGAIGTRGTHEKDITLAVARKLADRINHTPGYRAFLTRTGDYYVPLGKRVALARQHSPEIFISLHADAYRGPAARGASVYCLSERGKPAPDRALRALVERENSTDLIGGVDLGSVSDREVAGILMDLSQRDSLNRGLTLGGQLLSSLKQTTNLKFSRVMQAGFVVLKAPDIPSVLVEMAFLTNPEEELRLRQESHQEALAQALWRGSTTFIQATRKS